MNYARMTRNESTGRASAEISSEQSSTILFPIPINLMEGLGKLGKGGN